MEGAVFMVRNRDWVRVRWDEARPSGLEAFAPTQCLLRSDSENDLSAFYGVPSLPRRLEGWTCRAFTQTIMESVDAPIDDVSTTVSDLTTAIEFIQARWEAIRIIGGDRKKGIGLRKRYPMTRIDLAQNVLPGAVNFEQTLLYALIVDCGCETFDGAAGSIFAIRIVGVVGACRCYRHDTAFIDKFVVQ